MSLDQHIENHPTKVLFAVLNWGLGHATRSIPIIRYLISKDTEVMIASDGAALSLLKQEFPDLNAIKLLPYDVRYVAESVEYSLLIQLPGVLKAIKAEAQVAEELVQKHTPDMIISDSRFGFRSDAVKSIVIAHQLNLISDKIIFRSAGNIGNKKFLNRFDECWVPDYEGAELSGRLSRKKLQIPIRYIGPLSRFSEEEVDKDIDLLIVLSGPEPKRTRFSERLKPLLNNLDLRIVGVEGVVEEKVRKEKINNFDWYNYLRANKLNELINRSKVVLSRSGYTSIMDLVHLNKKAILVPTSGQSEQEYLGKHVDGKYNFKVVREEELEEKLAIAIRTLIEED